MKDIVENFINAKNILNETFNCNDDFFIKPLVNKKWTIKDNDGIFFLTYIDDSNKAKDCVIVKKNNEPMIYKKENYTMVIGIECVKLAFILDNNNLL
ncbi:hypothetical protein [[Clostridium] colinum]|uniref:hypothetical protein n=1 Tax=[Clostridium] colinum TaxID=36835 RepID=UPI002024BAA3|nr:hypothetical protein [[Clostridium] colinum]